MSTPRQARLGDFCRGEIYESQQEADDAAHSVDPSKLLVSQPQIYVCLDGHWHCDIDLLDTTA